jgi:hypothetical protein
MNSLLLDNWVMQQVAVDVFDFKSGVSETLSHFLSSIILWDEVCYEQNENSIYWSDLATNDLMDFLKPIECNPNVKEKVERKAGDLYNESFCEHDQQTAEGAIKYWLLSNSLGCDYFPAKDRQDFLRANFLNKEDYKNILNRLEYMNPLDNSIREAYSELAENLQFLQLELHRPVLTDYIVQNTPSNMSYIDYAINIREDKQIKNLENI